MKRTLITISLFIFIAAFKISSFGQNLSYQSSNQSKNNLTLPEDNPSVYLAATVFQASDDPFSIRVHFENYGEGKVTIKLNSSTTLLHKEIIEHKTYARRYNMYNLPVGDYRIEVENEKEVYTKRVSIKNEKGIRILTIL